MINRIVWAVYQKHRYYDENAWSCFKELDTEIKVPQTLFSASTGSVSAADNTVWSAHNSQTQDTLNSHYMLNFSFRACTVWPEWVRRDLILQKQMFLDFTSMLQFYPHRFGISCHLYHEWLVWLSVWYGFGSTTVWFQVRVISIALYCVFRIICKLIATMQILSHILVLSWKDNWEFNQRYVV